MNFHKQKLYSLIAAGIAFIALLLPWITWFQIQSFNGMRGWGILSLLGVIAVVALTLMEKNKTSAYSPENKKYAMIAFGAIAVGALLFFLTLGFNGVVKTGIGLWICLVAGLAGVALLYGLIKIEDKSVNTNL